MMELNSANIITGTLILILNLIPLVFRKTKYYGVTLPLSLLIAVIRIFFIK